MQHVEGQHRPKLRDRILHPFKGRVGSGTQPQREDRPASQLLQTPARENSHVSSNDTLSELRARLQALQQSYETNPFLDETAKASLRAFDENVERSWRELREKMSKEPKAKVSYQQWLDVIARKEREIQEKIARGEFPDINRSAPLVAEKLNFDETAQLTPQERKERNMPVVHALHNQLVKEVNKSELNLIAADIRTTMWRGNQTIMIEPVEKGKIDIKNDGTVYGGPKSLDSFGSKLRQNTTIRENSCYLLK